MAEGLAFAQAEEHAAHSVYKKVYGLLGTDEPLLWGRQERRLGLDSKEHSKEFTLYCKKTVWGLRSEKYFTAKKKRWNSGKWTGVGKKNREPYLHVCFCSILPPTYTPNKLITGRKHFIHFSLPTAQYRGGLNKSLLHKQRKAETHGLPILQVQFTSKAHQLIPVPLLPTPDPTFTPSSLMVFLVYSIQPLLVNSFMHSHLLLRTAYVKRIPFTLPIRLNSRLCSHYLAASAPGFFFKDLN